MMDSLEKKGLYLSFYEEILRQNSEEIKSLVSEFNARKKAYRNKHAKINETGMINPNKLYNYKLDDKIFLSRKKLGDAKSHGFVILLDWSGSMYTGYRHRKMLIQSIVFAEFCRRVGVPYRVYTYTDDGGNNYTHGKNKFYPEENPIEVPGVYIDDRNLFMLEILSSNFSKEKEITSKMKIAQALLISMDDNFTLVKNFERGNEYRKAREDLEKFGYGFGEYPERHDKNGDANKLFMMGCTPTLTAFMALDGELADFRAKNRIQKLNIIHITDGMANDTTFYENVYRPDVNGEMTMFKNTCSFKMGSYAPSSYRKFEIQFSNGDKLTIDSSEMLRKIAEYPQEKFYTDELTAFGLILNKIKEIHDANVIGYYLYGKEKSMNELIARGSKGLSFTKYRTRSKQVRGGEKKRSEKTKGMLKDLRNENDKGSFSIPDFLGHDRMILVKDTNISTEVFSMRKNMEKDGGLRKNLTVNRLTKAANETHGQNKKSRFLAIEVMKIAA